MGKFRTLALMLAVCMLVGCLFAACGKEKTGIEAAQKDPLGYLNTALEKTTETISSEDNGTLDTLITALQKEGTASVTADLPDVGTLSVLHSYNATITHTSLSLDILGQSVTAELWSNGTALCLKVPTLLGDDAYGFDFATLEQDLPNSEIWSMMGVSYEDVRAEMEPVIEQIKTMLDNQNADDLFLDKLAQAAQRMKLVFNEITYSAAEKGENAVDITCTMTKAQLDQLVDILMDATAEFYLNELSDLIDDDFAEELSLFRDTLKEVTGDVAVTFTISNESGLITAAHLEYTAQIDDEAVCLLADCDLSDPSDITLTLQASTDGVTEGTAALRLLTTEAERRMTLTVDDEQLMELYLTDSTFGGSLTDGDDICTFGGKYSLTEEELRITDLVLTYGDVSVSLSLCLTTNVDQAVEEMPDYRNILTMTEADWQALLENLYGIGF